MRFVDSHAHLAADAFGPDGAAVIDRAFQAGAAALVCIGDSLDAARRARELAAAHPSFVFHTAGVHPHDAMLWCPEAESAIRAEVAAGAVAIGECGLDYHYDHSPREAQRRAFAAQLDLAAELARPLVVHTREAEHDTRAMVHAAAAAGVRGVLHCYTGTLPLAEAALAQGWYISFSGIVTFRKWTDVALLTAVPDDRLLVESDAPYLAPVPHRGRRNEPAFVVRTIERLAAVRGADPTALGLLTARNACRLFGLRDVALDDTVS